MDPDRVWAACLKGISREQINFGLNQCALLGLEWPPSAPEFRALCCDDAGREQRIFAARARETAEYLKNEQLRITDQGKQERTKAKGASTLESLRGMFKGTAAGIVDQPNSLQGEG